MSTENYINEYDISPRIEIDVQWLMPALSTEQKIMREAFAAQLSHLLTETANAAIQQKVEEFKAGKLALAMSVFSGR